jgi:predicted house-cleaning noncanonical NTP pyrophosphatase (MazG superfamily)
LDKLVRDRIPEIVEANGDEPVVHRATDDEYGRRLRDKLNEEVAEYCESRDVEELADVLEVVHAIRHYRGVTDERLREIRERKAERRGRFEEGFVLERVET